VDPNDSRNSLPLARTTVAVKSLIRTRRTQVWRVGSSVSDANTSVAKKKRGLTR
jgi:hypothetical protein